MPPRIKYNNLVIDFGRDWNTYNDAESAKTFTNVALSGIQIRRKFFQQQFVRANIRLLDGQIKEELDHFFNKVNDGTGFEFWRDFDLGTYINFEGDDGTTTTPSLETNDGLAGTFTRTGVAGSAYYLNDHTGLFTVVAATNNLPRHPAGKYGDGILIEAARTNLLTNRVSNAAWTKLNMTAVSTSETESPAGPGGVDKLTATSSPGRATFDTSTAISTDDAVYSHFLKSSSGNIACTMFIADDTGVIKDQQAITVTPTWGETPFKSVFENGGSDADKWRVVLEIDTNTDIVYSWFTPQLEVGADVLYATQPIGAELTSSITRNGELLLYTAANIINRDKGTIAFWFNPNWIYNKHGVLVLFRSGASNANAHIDIVPQADGTIDVNAHANNDTTKTTLSASGSWVTQNSMNRLVVTYDSTVSNGIKLYGNGALIGTSSNDPFNASKIGTNFSIGGSLTAGSANSIIDEFEIHRVVRDSTWVSSDFNWGRGKAYGRNYYSSMILDSYKFNERKNGFFDVELVMKEELT